MGKDADGLCAILRGAGHNVATGSIASAPPRLRDLANDAAVEVLNAYRELGGRNDPPKLVPGSWDVSVDGILVELDEQLHFNRYRALTLGARSYAQLPRFPLAEYKKFCEVREADCLRAGQGQRRWMNSSTEGHFGPSGPTGDLSGPGSSRWKQRALYDFMKDLTQLNPLAPAVARIAIWDLVPGFNDVTVEHAVHRPDERRYAAGLRALIEDRAGTHLRG